MEKLRKINLICTNKKDKVCLFYDRKRMRIEASAIMPLKRLHIGQKVPSALPDKRAGKSSGLVHFVVIKTKIKDIWKN